MSAYLILLTNNVFTSDKIHAWVIINKATFSYSTLNSDLINAIISKKHLTWLFFILFTGSSNSSGSMKSSTLSIASSSNNRVYDVPSIRHSSDEYDEIPAPPPCPPMPDWQTNKQAMPDPPSSTHSDTMSSMSSPSVSSNSSTDGHGLKRCVALYTYANQNMEESNIPMEEGEEFWIVDEDCDGWTRVRRCCANPDYGDEGFVPTTWIRLIWSFNACDNGPKIFCLLLISVYFFTIPESNIFLMIVLIMKLHY